MNVTIMGSGGIGGCIGARLAAGGANVLFLARAAHLQALQTSGLKLTSALGDLDLPRVRAQENCDGEPPADFVIFTVKGPQTVAAAELIAPVVGPNTAIITFQNGVEGVDILQARFGKAAVLPGVTYIAALIEAPGHIRQIGTVNRSLFGETDGSQSTRGLAFRDMANSAGLECTLSTTSPRSFGESSPCSVRLRESHAFRACRWAHGPVFQRRLSSSWKVCEK